MRPLSLKALAYKASPSTLHPFIKRIENSNTGLRLARGMFWSMAGAIISQGLMLLATMLVARLLGKTGFGELAMIQSTTGMFGVFAGFGLGMTATKHVAEFRRKDPVRTGNIIAMAWIVAAATGGIMAIALVIFAPWLAANVINAPHLANILQISALFLFISALNGAQIGALSGFEAFKTIAKVNLAVGLFSFPVLTMGAYLGGVLGAVWALVLNIIFNWLLNHFALRRQAARYHVPLKFRLWQKELPLLWQFSLPAVLAGSLVAPINWLCGSLLVNQPNGYDELGVFNAANQLCLFVSFIPGVLGTVVLPIMSNQLGDKNKRESAQLLWLSIRLNILIIAPIIVVLSMLSPFIMALYGESFKNSWSVFVIMLLGTGLSATISAVGQILVASSRMWVGFAMNAAWAIVFLGGTYILLNNGALGMALARGIAYFCHLIWAVIFTIFVLRSPITQQNGVI